MTLKGAVVTACFPSSTCVYIEDPSRSAGVRVSTSRTDLVPGDVVDVSGVMSCRKPDGTNAVEREITSATITRTSSISALRPVAMSCRSIGGGPLAGFIPGVRGGVGASNVGLFVKTVGTVTAVSDPYFWLDDGSNITEISGHVGVFVEYPTNPPVAVGDIVGVSGIVGGMHPAGWTGNRRYIRMRGANDLKSYSAGTITGTVRDTSGAALAGVSITTATGGYASTTASDGTYVIHNVTPGTYSITASKEDYGSVVKPGVNVAVGGTANVDLALVYVLTDPFVTNGDFERGFASGVASGWSTWQSSWSNTITFSQETTAQMAGASAQKWGRTDSRRIHGGVCRSIPTIAGVTYEAIAWLRMDAADASSWLEAGVDLTGQLANGEAASVTYTKLEPSGNRKWVRYRKIVKATGTALSFFTKYGHSSETGGPDWAYVDNVTVQPRTALEAEDYVTAGDTTSGNEGGAYRTGDVDIGVIPDGSGYFVGWTDYGEWLEWTGVGSVGGDHALVIDYSGCSDAVVHVNVDGANVTGSLTLPRSGLWDGYRRVVAPSMVAVGQGSHTVRLTIDSPGCNIDRLTLVPISGCQTIQAENYSAYFDTTPGNYGGKYRSDDVDIYSNGGYYVGATASTEWLEYPVRGDGRTYVAVLRYLSSSLRSAAISVNGNNVTGSVALAYTGGQWKSVVTGPFTLSTGASTLRFTVESGGFSIDYIALVPLGDGGAGSDLLTGVHFAGSPSSGINDMASLRGAGQWIYSTEVYAGDNREPEDASFVANMTDLINSYLKPMYQNRIRPIMRIDHKWGETVPKLLAGDAIDTAAVSRYARTFRKFAQLADANGVPIRQFVVANEMNLKGEANGFTNGYIPEWYYAYVYDQVATQMAILGPGYEVLVGGMSPGTLTVDPLQTAPDPASFYQTYSTDSLVYLDNMIKEIKRRGTANVAFAMHAYNDFDASRNYTTSFYWTVRKQMEVIERAHTVVPYGQTQSVTVPGFARAPVYITEWNRHTPQNSADGRVFQETATSGFIRTAIERVGRWNRNREVWDNVGDVYRTYDHRDVTHNFHPVKALCYFVFDTLGGPWGDYSLKEWHTLADSATGADDMYNTYQSMIGFRDPAGR